MVCMDTIAVTGVSGQIGSRVAAGLLEHGIEAKLLLRDRTKAVDLPEERVAVAEYGDGPAARRALAGADLLFMVSAAESADRLEEHRAFIDAAAAAGVRHVVYTSFLGASPTATFTLARDHAATEDHLRASGMDWTLLRDSFYLDLLPQFAGEDGVIRGPAGAGRVGAVLRADVARCAAGVLADECTGARSHAGASYDLTGPEALTLTEIAQIVSDETGRHITFHDETVEEAYASRAAYGAPPWQLDAWVSTYTAIKAGELDAVTSAVTDLTGTPPGSLREHLHALR
ncbi:MAG TPA: SDR family oxidoreductase [Candidatus Ruania gallistercoris]|uniref:SDR family oxidoreductase n=1 Tax=Candidatus Ruania gallistercoris TaxID=2838746 RepID=A0A9D2EBL4_9MICO|nr:SDR family oxidoreductase [Candidatus Ruania gallistercoris]